MIFSNIPIDFCGPISISSDILEGEYKIPIATFEKTLFPSINRGALVSKYSNRINVKLINHGMTRSILLKFDNIEHISSFLNNFQNENFLDQIKKIVKSTSKFCELRDIYKKQVGDLLFIRFSFNTEEASGHNMTTKASDEIIQYILSFSTCEYISVSGNLCTDKKNSSINSILGRGREINAEITISEKICLKILKSTPEKIYKLNQSKNLIGSILAGSNLSANAHFANIIAGFYIATGQDVANVVEGSQGITYCDIKKNGDLYFSVNCPNIILGAIGNGKNYDFIQDNIDGIGFQDKENLTNKMSIVLGAGILCGELSLLASLTNFQNLVSSHLKYERRN